MYACVSLRVDACICMEELIVLWDPRSKKQIIMVTRSQSGCRYVVAEDETKQMFLFLLYIYILPPEFHRKEKRTNLKKIMLSCSDQELEIISNHLHFSFSLTLNPPFFSLAPAGRYLLSLSLFVSLHIFSYVVMKVLCSIDQCRRSRCHGV